MSAADAYWALFALTFGSVLFVLAMIPVGDWLAQRARERKTARKINRGMGR